MPTYHDPTADLVTNVAPSKKGDKEKLPPCAECFDPTDQTYMKRPVCRTCKAKIEVYRQENGMKTRISKLAKRRSGVVKIAEAPVSKKK